MKSYSRSGDRKFQYRLGFSLIELMVVILIIAIVSAMLLVGVQAAVGRARVATVAVEIKNLEQAIKEFQTKFSVTDAPPSRIVLYENYSLWPDATMATSGSAAHRGIRQNVAAIRRLWPNFLGTDGKPAIGMTWAIDFNLDTDTDDTLELSGSECLVFFLAGLLQKSDSGDGYIASGFSTNPQNPFSFGGSRVGPFFPFAVSRLEDRSGNTYPEYIDAFPSSLVPYQYFSAYGGRGYLPLGADGTVGGTGADADEVYPGSGLISVYLQKDVNWSMAMALPKAGVAWNAKTFQIISAGRDGQWGLGGEVTNEEVRVNGAAPYRAVGQRAVERDNLTNFKGGPLE